MRRLRAGKSWVHFCAHDSLWGLVLFGRPDRRDAEEMMRSFVTEIAPETPAHGVLLDVRGLELVDPGAFQILQQFALVEVDRLRRKIERVAVVQSVGVEAAVVAGFYRLLTDAFPVEPFGELGPAWRWLGETDGAALAVELDDAVAGVRGTTPMVGALRLLLRDPSVGRDLGQVCRALGVTRRTIQRRLREAGTSFQAEVQVARVEGARQRLATSDDPITVIALESGFASSQHFSRCFRAATGASPSEWRARHRR